MKTAPELSLYDLLGQRKYLSTAERDVFYQLAEKSEIEKKLFYQMLFYTGGRISEILSLKGRSIDLKEGVVIIESLKKRKKGIYRVVPIPITYINLLKKYIKSRGVEESEYLWTFSRRTASRYIKSIMNEASINGVQASAKGLRHSFAIRAIEKNIPLTLIKNWMGHSSITTTEIYLNVVGKEERRFAKRMW